MVKYGNTWRAIGPYHWETPKQRDAYARSIQRVLVDWGQLPSARQPLIASADCWPLASR